jgi:diguanylate cyclase (GGDEF)-like protein
MSERPAILCIDDDRVQHRLVQQMVKGFRSARFDCDVAASYAEGLDRLMSGRYTVCLLDYRLDPGDGLELLREARRGLCDTPVIMITADDSEEVNIAASEAGAVDFLAKEELTSRVLERAVRYAVKMGGTLTRLRELAQRDELTGILNRREIYRILQDECQRSARFKRPFSFALVDIDLFKRVNDEHGHPAGDQVLRHVAQLLADRLRRVDRVGRFGGEEFAIVMPETARREGIIAMERMRGLLRQHPCVLAGPGLTLNVTFSAGVALSPEDADNADGLISVADKALYAAKHGGRDRVMAPV